MKKVILILAVVLCVITFNVSAQKVHIDQITITEGRGALASGLNATLWASSGDNLYGLEVGSVYGNFRLGKKFVDKEKWDLSGIVTIGAFKNVPWAGPMISYNYHITDSLTLSLFSWSGMGIAKEKEFINPGFRPTFFFHYNSVNVHWKNNDFGYGLMWATVDPLNHFLIYKRSIPVGPHKLFLESTYNYREDLMMFMVGYTHNFK